MGYDGRGDGVKGDGVGGVGEGEGVVWREVGSEEKKVEGFGEGSSILRVGEVGAEVGTGGGESGLFERVSRDGGVGRGARSSVRSGLKTGWVRWAEGFVNACVSVAMA